MGMHYFSDSKKALISVIDFAESEIPIPIWNAIPPKHDTHQFNAPTAMTAERLVQDNLMSSEKISIFSNVYFWFDGSFLYENTVYYRDSLCHMHAVHHESRVRSPYNITYLPSVVMAAHFFQSNYGHSFHEVIAPYSAMPKFYIESNMVSMALGATSAFIPLCQTIGFEEDQIRVQNLSDLFFSSRYHFIDPGFCHSTLMYNYQTMAQHIRRYFNGDSIPSNKYILINRRGPIRNISNFDSVVAWCRTNYPSVKWDTYHGSSSLHVQAHTFLQAKFVLACHGADLANILFMREGGVHCEIMLEGEMNNHIIAALSTHKIPVIGCNTSWGWYRGTLNYLDHGYLAQLVGYSIQRLHPHKHS